MRWLSILKKVGVIAGKTVVEVAATSHPLIGGLSEVIFRNILTAESTFGAGNGTKKRDMVLAAVDAAAPLVLKLAEISLQRDLADDELFASGVAKITDGYVDLMNSIRMLPKEEKPS
jgi:hypothetical protein